MFFEVRNENEENVFPEKNIYIYIYKPESLLRGKPLLHVVVSINGFGKKNHG